MTSFILAAGLSALLYMVLSPIILSFISVPAIAIWAVALTPIWILTYKQIKNFANERLKNIINQIEIQIKKNDTFIKEKWPVNIDIRKDDLNHWAERALKYQKVINKCLTYCRYQSHNWKEHPWILDNQLHTARLSAVSKLEEQKQLIKKQLVHLVEQVPKQMDGLILQIKPDFRNPQQFVPELEIGKLEKLTDFVNQYGSEDVKKEFAKNTNLINLFVKDLALEGDLKHAKFIFKKQKPSPVGAPWGEYMRVEAQFKGWHHLINGWMVKGEKKDALIAVLLLLEGKLSLSPEALDKHLKTIENEALSTRLKSHLFLVLDNNSYIPLLTLTDKQKLENWYQSHKTDILKAQEAMKTIFKDPSQPIPSLPELAQYFNLLDSAILISSIQSEYIFENLIRNYFENYTGDHPYAHIFLRFIPEDKAERIQFTQRAQTKRLEWFIQKAQLEGGLDANAIHPEEVSLFNDRHIDPKLALTPCDFIGKQIIKHPLYKAPYSPAFKSFLELFSRYAFCNAKIKTDYLQEQGVGTRAVTL